MVWFDTRKPRIQKNGEFRYEKGFIRYAGEYYVVAGRYSWTSGRGSVNPRKHGGLSIMECMTPVLRVEKR